MGTDEIQFRSKIGAIIIIPAVVVLLLGGASAANAMLSGRPVLAAVLTLPIALVAWIALTTRYTLTSDHLAIRSAFVNSSIPLRTIRSVRPTSTALSAPALSMDRLEITHDGGIAVISPDDRARFLAEIRVRCPHAEIRVV
jgi:hypothetical protein